MTRATSTVLDVALFLLLVGAAAAALVGGATVEGPPAGNPASERGELLATSTAAVDYELVVPGPEPSWVGDASARRQRTAHGTLAALLGEAAMSRVRIDGTRVSLAGRRFEQQVGATVGRRLADRRYRTSVRVTWTLYPGAPVTGRFRLGPRPPASADVRAATVTVASGLGNATSSTRVATREAGYRGVARAVAKTVVDGLFPPDRSRVALQGDYPDDAVVARRYRRVGRITGVDPLDVGGQSVAATNRELTVALTDLLTADLRSRFESPAAATAAVDTETVHITVRTWSP
ncbi:MULTISPECIES: DUF7284 family protein [Haloarcula]|uniref:DUF7284 family protein n=1 Tax=Haloarcula TaxID=2237 RepID=UPI0023EC2A21|nr:hypothetical protein [Halomicroarcula sp. XH51]